MGRIFIVWERRCTRSENIAKHFNAKLINIYPFTTKSNTIKTILRYIISSVVTIFTLIRKRPSFVFVMNLPFPLIITVFLYSRIIPIKYILDSHSGPFTDKRWQVLKGFYKLIAKKAFLNINTCIEHKTLVEKWGGESLIISDVPISFGENVKVKKIAKNSIAVVCSYNYDEPIMEIWGAAIKTPEINYYLTGNYKLLSKNLLENKPANIHLLGFIPYDDYYSTLKSVSAVMVLTNRDNTMQRGAYEALALEQPIITSDYEVLRNSFGEAAVYTDNSTGKIAMAAKKTLENINRYKESAKNQKIIRLQYFIKIKKEIELKLANSN